MGNSGRGEVLADQRRADDLPSFRSAAGLAAGRRLARSGHRQRIGDARISREQRRAGRWRDGSAELSMMFSSGEMNAATTRSIALMPTNGSEQAAKP